MNQRPGDGFLIKLLLFGLLAGAIIVCISYYVSTQVSDKSIQGATAGYIKDNGITGTQAQLMKNATKEAHYQDREDAVKYHTLTLQYSMDLSMFIQRINTIHYEVVRSGNDATVIEYAYEELESVKNDMLNMLEEVGNINPPVNKIEDHQYLIENMAEAIVELDLYQTDVIEGRVYGPNQNEHFTKLKNIMSRMQSIR